MENHGHENCEHWTVYTEPFWNLFYFKNVFSSSDDEEVEKEVGDDDTEKTPEEKLKLLKRQSPELFPLLAELKVYKAELSNLLIPLTKIFTEQGKS